MMDLMAAGDPANVVVRLADHLHQIARVSSGIPFLSESSVPGIG